MTINIDKYRENLKKRRAAVNNLQNPSGVTLRASIEKRSGCPLFSKAIEEIDKTHDKVNECRMSKGLKPLPNILDRTRI